MKEHLLIAGLAFGLSGLGAVAQTSTTPGVPAPNDHTPPYAQANQDNQNSSDQNHTYSDQQGQQQYPEASDHRDRNGNNNDQNGQNDQSNGHYEPNQNDRQYQSSQGWRNDRDRGDQDQQNGPNWKQPGDHAYDRSASPYISGNSENAYSARIQEQLQRSDLKNVSINDTGSRIILNGTVNSQGQRREAERIAQSYARGRQVVDRLHVSEHGYPR